MGGGRLIIYVMGFGNIIPKLSPVEWIAFLNW